MNRIIGISIPALAAMVLAGCSSSNMAHKGEYDDMYYGSADRQRDSFKDVSFNEYSNFKEDTDPIKIDKGEQLKEDSYSAKTINPDYIAKYNTEATEEESNGYGDGEYFVDDYNSKPTVVNNYYGYSPYRYNYRYDPFYDSFYDPFYNPYYSYYRPGLRISVSYNYGYGYGSGFYGWNNSYLYGPYWGYTPSYAYTALYCPSSGYYYGGYYGYNSYSPWNYGNVVYYNNNYVNVNPDNISTNTRKIVKGPRPNRGSVNGVADNTNRAAISRTNNTSGARTDLISNSQGNYYRRSRINNEIVNSGPIEPQRSAYSRSRDYASTPIDNSRPSTNYVRPKTSRSSLNNVTNSQPVYRTIQRSGDIPRTNAPRSNIQRSSTNYNNNNRSSGYRQSSPVQNTRSYQNNRSSTPTRTVSPSRTVTPSRSTPSKSGNNNSRSGNNNSSSSNSRRNNN